MMVTRAEPTPRERLQESINLSLGEPCFEPPKEARSAAAAALLQGSNGYLPPGGLPELRIALAQKLRDQNGIAADPNQVVVTVGASLGLFTTIAVLCQPGAGVLIPDPCFPLYKLMLETQRLCPLRYPLRADRNYEPDWDALESQASACSALIWNFPSNPLGVVARPSWLSRLNSLLKNHPHLHLISDEVYEDLLFAGKHHSPAATADPLAERVFSVFSFSKSYAMTGWRVGYVHAPGQWAARIEQAHWGAAMSTPTIAQCAAVAALRAAPSYREETLGFLKSNRAIALAKLRKWGLSCTKPEAGLFVWINVSRYGMDSLTFAKRCEEECGVIVSPGVYFSPNAINHIRLCFAVDSKALVEGIDRLGGWLDRLYRSRERKAERQRSVRPLVSK
jgi:aspartate aminotransferase